MHPGDFASHDRRVSVAIRQRCVDLAIVGTPEELTAWAEQVLAMAEQLRVEADAYEDALDGEEVAF
jgi:hypothetical protein